MGVKIAHALGAEVTVLSQSLRSRTTGWRFGADHYYATSDDQTFSELAGTFDLIVNTVSATLPMDKYLSLLGLDGTMVNVGAPSGSAVGAGVLAAHHAPQLGRLDDRRHPADPGDARLLRRAPPGCRDRGHPGEQIDEAYDRVVGSDVRYRFVIDTRRSRSSETKR